MKLIGKVVEVRSKSLFTDKTERIVVRVDQEDRRMHDTLELKNNDGWKLDDEIEIYLFTVSDKDPLLTLDKAEAELDTVPLSEFFVDPSKPKA